MILRLSTLLILIAASPARANEPYGLRLVRRGSTLRSIVGRAPAPTLMHFGDVLSPERFDVLLRRTDGIVVVLHGRQGRIETDKQNFLMVRTYVGAVRTAGNQRLILDRPVVMKVYIGGHNILDGEPGEAEPALLEVGDDVFEIIDPFDPRGPRPPGPRPSPCGDRLVDA